MKYTTVILAFVAGVFAVPQASITSAPVAAPIPSGLTPAVSCALSCTPGDVMCQAACLGNARPNASQVIDTNKCAANCDQGDGSAAAAVNFGLCVDGCINSLFPSSQTAFAPGAAQASNVKAGAGASATGSSSVQPTGSAGSQPSGSSSGSAAIPQSTGAADMNSVRLASAGLAGLLAIFAF